MKRTHPDEPQGFRGISSSGNKDEEDDMDDAEMDVVDKDNEEKAERDDDDDDDEPVVVADNSSSPFLDSFYGISSASAPDRARAAHILLSHCLLQPPQPGAAATTTTNTSTTTTTTTTNINTMKDAAYALRRLMNGLCSGRAAARQGNAATLASFLKLAFVQHQMGDIRRAAASSLDDRSSSRAVDDVAALSDLAFVRHALRAATEPSTSNQGGSSSSNKKGSEERDYRFGRLFGINGMVRSGILLQLPLSSSASLSSVGDDNDTLEKDVTHVTASLLTDLTELYRYKKWMREPAAHAVCTLLHAFHCAAANANAATTTTTTNDDSNSSYSEHAKAAARVLAHMVEHVVVPQLLAKGDFDTDGSAAVAATSAAAAQSLLASYSAEQIGIALHIQSSQTTMAQEDDLQCTGQRTMPIMRRRLPFPLDTPVLTVQTVPLLAAALSETSGVTQPRTHLVWDTLWSYLTESVSSSASSSSSSSSNHRNHRDATNNVDLRKTRKVCPVSGESVNDLLGAVLQHVVMERLLGIDPACHHDKQSSDDQPTITGGGKGSGKTTHERRALALCLVRNLTGVEFISSVSGRTRLYLEPDMLERLVFHPVLVRRLFLDVICAGTGQRPSNKQSSSSSSAHMLKPLALQILEQSARALLYATTNSGVESSDQTLRKRLSVASALLRCEPRFDSRTKTVTVESLLGLNNNADATAVSEELVQSLWEPYLSFLERRIVTAEPTNQKENAVSSYEAQGYIDLLFHLGKRLLRSDAGDEKSVLEFKENSTKRILGFLMAIAFFDCSDCKAAEPTSESKKKKKDKKRQSVVVSKQSPVVDTALMIKVARAGTTSMCPYDMRTVASARFFSLVADCVTTKSHSSSADKESSILDLLSDLHEMQKQLIGAGAKQGAASSHDTDEMDAESDISPESIVTQLRKEAQACRGSDKDARKRWTSGCAILASTLSLHLLSCGQPDFGHGDDDPDADEDEDFEEITGLLSDLHHVAALYSKGSTADDSDKPLAALAKLCASILSSPIGAGNQSRGASPTLLREVVKFAWTGGLSMTAVESEESALDNHVVNILLNALGAIDDTVMEGDEEEDDEDDSENDEDSTGSSEEGVFASATGVIVRDQEMSEGSDDDKDSLGDKGEDEELEIDELKLQAMLEEGSDADIDEGELEHHEGADAALAKLIQLKQDARKAGQLARERTEIARQIRCILLLETLVVGKAETWGSLLRVDLIMQMILPILQYRKELVKSLSKATEKGSSTGSGEKRALLDRLTALLKTKILKAKVPDNMKWTESVSVTDLIQDYASSLFRQAKETEDKEHQSLCNSGLIFMLRSIPDNKAKLETAQLYADAVSEWATKRTTRLDSTFFEGLIHQNPVIAQACLGTALASAASTGRSTFLKSESFRLLSLLYNTKLNPNVSDLDKMATDRIIQATVPVLASVAASLKDVEMKKTKRVREVLRTAERVVLFLASSSHTPAQSKVNLGEVKELLKRLKTDSESQGITKTAEMILSAIDDLLSKKPTTPAAEEPVIASDEESDESDTGAAEGSKKLDSAKSKKKKQKSKKKKRR